MLKRIRTQFIRQRLLVEIGSIDIEGLNLAIRKGNLEAVQYFVRMGIALGEVDSSQYSAVYTAVNYWQINLLEILIDGKATLNDPDKEGKTPLIRALELQQREAAVALLRAGARPDVVDQYGRSALMIASSQGRTFLIEELLKKGAVISRQDERGRDALTYAVKEGKIGVVKLLLENDANPYQQDKTGSRALDYAGRDLEIIRLLREAMNNIPPDDVDENDSYPRSVYLEAFQEFISRLSPERTVEGLPAEEWIKLISESWELVLGFLAITGILESWRDFEKRYIFVEERNEKIKKEIEWFLQLLIEIRSIIYALNSLHGQIDSEQRQKIHEYRKQLTTVVAGMSAFLTKLVEERERSGTYYYKEQVEEHYFLDQALRKAVSECDEEMVKLLLNAGANPAKSVEGGLSAWELAANHPQILHLLMVEMNKQKP